MFNNLIQRAKKFFQGKTQNLDVNTLHVYWKHIIPGVNDEDMGPDGLGCGSICYIKKGNDIISEGRAFLAACEPQFNKKTGRRISMQRAVSALELSKQQREELYARYLNQIKTN